MLTGKKAVAIILLIVGAMLMFFIISQGIGIYKGSRESSDRQGLSSVQCFGFLYSVREIIATEEELQFEFRNEISSTEEVHNLTIMGTGAGAGQSRSTVGIGIPIGSSLAVRVPVRVEDNFTVYPDNCQLYPMRCTLEGECAYK